MKFMFITLWYSQLCLCPTALGRGNFLLFIGLTSSLINLILVLCIPLSIPMPFYFFRVCNQWHNSAVELQKLKLSACVMLITQGLGVAYILERGARPIGIGRGHTKSFNPVNVKNVSHNCNGRNSISTTQTEYSFMFNFIPLFTIKAFLIMVPLQPIEFILHYSCRYISGWLYLCSYKLELSIERSICSFMRHLGEVSTMLICQGLMERRQV